MTISISRATRKGIDDAAAALREAASELQSALEHYDAKRSELYTVIESTVDGLKSEFDVASTRWQEGEKGQATQEWIDGIEEKLEEIEALDVELPNVDEVIDFPDKAET